MTDWENAVKDGVVQVAGSRLSQEDVCVKLVLTGAGTDCGVADPTGTASGGLAQPTISVWSRCRSESRPGSTSGSPGST